MPQDFFSPVRLSMDLDREIENAFSRLIHQPWGRCTGLANWQPAVDVLETDDAYLIEADLPGVAQQDVEIRVDDHRLVLRGQRRSLQVSQTGREVRVERSRGEFERSVTLIHAVDPEHMQAHCQDGILHVRLPKRSPSST